MSGNIVGMFSSGNGRKEDRLSAAYDGLVKVLLLSLELIALQLHHGKAVDANEVLRMKSRVRE